VGRCKRAYCDCGLFRHRDSGSKVVVLNVHLDDQGVVARREAAGLLRNRIAEWMWKDDEREKGSVLLAGDLNSEGSGDAYEVLTAGPSRWLMDAAQLGWPEETYGEKLTFTGFEGKQTEKKKLDYVFVGPWPENHCWEVRGYAVLPNRFEDGVYHSDHRAVVADVLLR